MGVIGGCPLGRIAVHVEEPPGVWRVAPDPARYHRPVVEAGVLGDVVVVLRGILDPIHAGVGSRRGVGGEALDFEIRHVGMRGKVGIESAEIERPVRSSAAGPLPLRFERQTEGRARCFGEPLAEGGCLVPGDTHHGLIGSVQGKIPPAELVVAPDRHLGVVLRIEAAEKTVGDLVPADPEWLFDHDRFQRSLVGISVQRSLDKPAGGDVHEVKHRAVTEIDDPFLLGLEARGFFPVEGPVPAGRNVLIGIRRRLRIQGRTERRISGRHGFMVLVHEGETPPQVGSPVLRGGYPRPDDR